MSVAATESGYAGAGSGKRHEPAPAYPASSASSLFHPPLLLCPCLVAAAASPSLSGSPGSPCWALGALALSRLALCSLSRLSLPRAPPRLARSPPALPPRVPLLLLSLPPSAPPRLKNRRRPARFHRGGGMGNPAEIANRTRLPNRYRFSPAQTSTSYSHLRCAFPAQASSPWPSPGIHSRGIDLTSPLHAGCYAGPPPDVTAPPEMMARKLGKWSTVF